MPINHHRSIKSFTDKKILMLLMISFWRSITGRLRPGVSAAIEPVRHVTTKMRDDLRFLGWSLSADDDIAVDLLNRHATSHPIPRVAVRRRWLIAELRRRTQCAAAAAAASATAAT